MCRGITRALGLEPKAPALPPIEPMPALPPPVQNIPQQMEQADAAGQAAERERARKARGRAATILTGGQGDTSTPDLARPTATGGRTLLA
jgi:hypothetical protein